MAKTLSDTQIHKVRILLEKYKKRDEVDDLDSALREAACHQKTEREGYIDDALVAVESMRADLRKILDILTGDE